MSEEDDPFDLDRLLDGAKPLPPVRVVPANEASWEDLKAILGGAGYHGGCWCQRMKLKGEEWWYKTVPPEERARRLEAQTGCGDPDAATTSGLVAYWGDEPVGWCNVEPRSHFVRMGQAPWKGRQEDPKEEGVWCVACTIVKARFRHKGVSRALALAAVEFARARGAKALEGYGMITHPGQDITWGELHVGAVSAFAAAGLREVHRPSKRRVVMRIEF
jgi:GNAT superfamily N-acetyltransferase